MSEQKQVTSARSYRKGRRVHLTLKSGNVFEVQRPSPDVYLRAARLPTNLTTHQREAEAGQSAEEVGRRFFTEMSDEEFTAFMTHAREMVMAVCVNPRVVVGASPESDTELDPDELLSADFFELYAFGQRSGAAIPVQVEGGGEVTIADLEKFREDGGVQEVSPPVEDLRSKAK